MEWNVQNQQFSAWTNDEKAILHNFSSISKCASLRKKVLDGNLVQIFALLKSGFSKAETRTKKISLTFHFPFIMKGELFHCVFKLQVLEKRRHFFHVLKNDVPEALVNDWSCQLVIAQLLSKGSFPIIVAGRYHNKLDEIATTFWPRTKLFIVKEQTKFFSSKTIKKDTTAKIGYDGIKWN